VNDAEKQEQLQHSNDAFFGIGSQLARARVDRGLTLEDAAIQLKMLGSTVRDLENERFSRIGAPIFVRGFLRSYGKLVGIDSAFIEKVCAAIDAGAAPLLPSAGNRSANYPWLERYRWTASYAVGTILLVSSLSAIFNSGALRRQSAEMPLVAAKDVEQKTSQTRTATGSVILERPAAQNQLEPQNSATQIVPSNMATIDSALAHALASKPMMASIATFGSGVPDSATQVTLRVSQTSWVQIVDGEGKRLEFANLVAGSEKIYVANAPPLTISIGDARGASLKINSESVSLDPFERGNVVKLRLVQSNGHLVAEALSSRNQIE
jgi:cytoskeleton protein RodZ